MCRIEMPGAAGRVATKIGETGRPARGRIDVAQEVAQDRGHRIVALLKMRIGRHVVEQRHFPPARQRRLVNQWPVPQPAVVGAEIAGEVDAAYPTGQQFGSCQAASVAWS
jgi:hypothetical protein